MSTEELIDTYSNENGFLFGIDTVMKVLRPNALYCLKVENGNFTIVSWDKTNKQNPPSSQEIKEEYIRHKAIKETIDYINSKE
jgi:hypothetical protein